MKTIRRIIYLIAVIAIAHAGAQKVNAQSVSDINIDELKTPSSPGFILMDEAPASVEKPSTPQGLAVSILNLSQGGALEIAPAWLYNHKNLTFDDYVKEKFPIYKSASVSLATTKKSDTLHLAFGIRTHLVRLRSKASRDSINIVKDSIVALLSEDSINIEAIKSLSSKLEKAMQPTFVIELAAAYLGQSLDGSFSNLTRARTGIWLNASYKPFIGTPIELLALGRFVKNPYFGEYKKEAEIFDAGFRAAYSFYRSNLSIEYVARKVRDGESYDRFAGIFEYKLNENIYATATFGQNFNKERDIIALIGVSFGISQKTSFK